MYLAETKDCPPGAALEVIVSGRVIALLNVNGKYFALDGICPHQGGPLGKGQLSQCASDDDSQACTTDEHTALQVPTHENAVAAKFESASDWIVTCPWHGWQFKVTDGTCLISDEIQQPTIPVKVIGDQVFANFDTQ